jgi:branched-chain amino acid transport system substrate-binding protein
VIAAAKSRLNVTSVHQFTSPAGIAHAYDLTHILARALRLARTTDRVALRDALEQVRGYDGLVRRYAAPFTPTRHEALSEDDLFMAHYDRQGQLVRHR